MDVQTVEFFVLKTAINKGWKIQPNQKKYKALIKAMAKKAEGDIVICPCKVYVKELVDIKQVMCPCNEAESDLNSTGECHCNMFQKEILGHD